MHRILLAAALMIGVTTAIHAAEIVRYQCPQWKAKHIHDADKADKIAKTLKDLGCETKRDQHNGHIDIKYKCEKWRQLDLQSHDEAHRWEKWLKEFGFNVEHKH